MIFSVLQLLLTALLLVMGTNRSVADYDPLTVSGASDSKQITTQDFSIHDAKRTRAIPIRVYLPRTASPQPVVLFSHGLGGSRSGYAFIGEHWARRGYVAVFVQHPGSDDSVWRNERVGQRFQAMQEAASLENLLLRVRDIPAVLDGLETWNRQLNHPLAGRLDLTKVGMSGHSFGALTTEAVSGESLPVFRQALTDKRIKAAIAFSPSSPRGMDSNRAFGAVHVPWLLMTGTKDVSIIGNADLKSRLAVYPALKGAPKYEVVLFNAEHSAFTDRALPGDREKRNPNHHRVILALSTAFWDAYLRHDAQAVDWLNGSGPRTILHPEDSWQLRLQ